MATAVLFGLCSCAHAGVVKVLAGEGSLLFHGYDPKHDKPFYDDAPFYDDTRNLYFPNDVAVGVDGSVVFTDQGKHHVILLKNGKFTKIAGTGWGGNMLPFPPKPNLPADDATNIKLENLGGVAVCVDGSVVITDTTNHRVLLVKNGKATKIAGTGHATDFVDFNRPPYDRRVNYVPTGPDQTRPKDDATNTQLFYPHSVAVGVDGSIAIADRGRVIVVRDGKVKVIAGTGIDPRNHSPNAPDTTLPADDATNTQLGSGLKVAVGINGSVVIAERGNHRVLLVREGKAKVIAGMGKDAQGNRIDPDPNLPGDDATNTQLFYPQGVAVGIDGSVYIADQQNHRVLIVKDGKATNFAGTRDVDPLRPSDAATNTSLKPRPWWSPCGGPVGVAVAVDGSVVIADNGAARVLLVAPEDNHQKELDRLTAEGLEAISNLNGNSFDKESVEELRRVLYNLTYLAAPEEKNAQATSSNRLFISEFFHRLPQEMKGEILNQAKEPSDSFHRLRAILAFQTLTCELSKKGIDHRNLLLGSSHKSQ